MTNKIIKYFMAVCLAVMLLFAAGALFAFDRAGIHIEAGEPLSVFILSATVAAALALALAALAASKLAKRITGHINALEPDKLDGDNTYEELVPLVEKFRRQNRTIRRQLDELGRQQREFSAITDNMSEGFFITDGRTNVLSGNQRAFEMMPGGAKSMNLRSCDCPQKLREAVEGALSGERTERILSIDCQSFHVIANPVTVDGQVTGSVVIIMDITEREQREALRREFSANVSHELKTPLTSISGFAELMKDGLVPPDKIPEFSGDIYKESMRLIDLVDDIIKLSRLDEDTPEFEKEAVDLYALSEEVIESLAPVAERRGISLGLEGVHARISGVWQILSEMIYNLCDNAIKYNVDGGSVNVRVSAAGSEVSVCVEDTGIGIPQSHISRVFERFYRVDKSHSKEIGGTGLGLSIVKHGAIYHNARILTESELGKGTKITLIF